jgi:hypothetical protein
MLVHDIMSGLTCDTQFFDAPKERPATHKPWVARTKLVDPSYFPWIAQATKHDELSMTVTDAGPDGRRIIVPRYTA